MPNILRRLKIREVSSVDRGAGEGVRVVLTKRAFSEKKPGSGKGPRERASNGTQAGRRPMTLFEQQQAARAAYGSAPGIGGRDRRGRQRHLKVEGSVELSPKVEKYLQRNIFVELGINKRDVSPNERQHLATEGHAMPGGGYPIANVGDLKNAIRAIGRAKDPGKTRSHIRRQAARLGRTDLIPEGWGGGKIGKAGFGTSRGYRSVGGRPNRNRPWSEGRTKAAKEPAFPNAAPPFTGDKKKEKAFFAAVADLGAIHRIVKDAVSFDQILAEMSSTDYAEGIIEAVRDACHALKDSIESIAECDDIDPGERASAISESFEQFMDHLSGISPDNVTKAFKKGVGKMSKFEKQLRKTFTSVPAHNATPPTTAGGALRGNEENEDVTEPGGNPPKTATTPPSNKEKLQKKLRKMQKKLRKMETRSAAAIALSKTERDYMDAAGKDMKDEEKQKFLDMSPKQRAKHIEANPIEKRATAHLDALPEPIRKQLAEGRDAVATVVKMRTEAEVTDFAKRATDIGQPVAFGEHLRLLAKGLGTEEERQKAFDEVYKALEAANKQVREAGLFKEWGTGRGATGSALDQLYGKAEALRSEVNKTASKPLSVEQAFEKVYTDPANADLVKQYNEEKRRAA